MNQSKKDKNFIKRTIIIVMLLTNMHIIKACQPTQKNLLIDIATLEKPKIMHATMQILEMRPADYCKQLASWQKLEIEKKHNRCGLPYFEASGFARVSFLYQQEDGTTVDCTLGNPNLLKKAIVVEFHKKNKKDIVDPQLLGEYMLPRIPEWISVVNVSTLQNEDILNFSLYGLKVEAKIDNIDWQLYNKAQEKPPFREIFDNVLENYPQTLICSAGYILFCVIIMSTQ